MDRAYQEKLFALKPSTFHGETSSGNIGKHTLISHFSMRIAHFALRVKAQTSLHLNAK
jgi:hypothetical protein